VARVSGDVVRRHARTYLGADDTDEMSEDQEPEHVLAFVFAGGCAEREFAST
jgi:hypothetical protein